MNFCYNLTPFYFVSFIIFFIVFLFFIGIGGSLNAYIKSFIGDNEALEKGYGSINPFFHINIIWILIFFLIKIIVRENQPFSWNWKNGIKGFFQKIIFIFGSTFFHFLISSILLFFSVKIWGKFFFQFALNTPINPSIELIKSVKLIFNKISSINIILILFSLYSITTNIFLGLIDFLLKISEYIAETYIIPRYSNFFIILLSYIFIIQFFFIFSTQINIFCWNLISLPIIYFN